MKSEYKLVCPQCGAPLQLRWEDRAPQYDKIEMVCSCTNPKCLLDWEIGLDLSGNIQEIKRYFFG